MKSSSPNRGTAYPDPEPGHSAVRRLLCASNGFYDTSCLASRRFIERRPFVPAWHDNQSAASLFSACLSLYPPHQTHLSPGRRSHWQSMVYIFQCQFDGCPASHSLNRRYHRLTVRGEPLHREGDAELAADDPFAFHNSERGYHCASGGKRIPASSFLSAIMTMWLLFDNQTGSWFSAEHATSSRPCRSKACMAAAENRLTAENLPTLLAQTRPEGRAASIARRCTGWPLGGLKLQAARLVLVVIDNPLHLPNPPDPRLHQSTSSSSTVVPIASA